MVLHTPLQVAHLFLPLFLPLLPGHLREFERRAFGVGEPDPDGAIARREASGRLKVFSGAALLATKDVNLDIGLIDPHDEDAATPKMLTELTFVLSVDLRGALTELEAPTEEHTDLPKHVDSQ
ncbi:hypothetical protein [Streptosporangium sp. CA-115845]|uniref:hypothetical protein n=1 Tax=Streptosporangium sp. CA-115845 TaxID=3240071 RepID=UPI003D8BBC7F